MRICYLDCFSGISGDMLLGAFVDAGLSPQALEAELRKLRLEGWSLATEKVRRGALTAIKLDFQIQETHHHRTWKKIREMIRSCGLSEPVRDRAESIFGRLAEAEAAVHGVAPDEVHFHEVGALDSILDIVGASLAVELLGIERFVVSPLNTGTGTVKTAHGALPVPAPATAALLKGAPVYSSGIDGELVTPTGAAVVAALASEFGSLPAMTVSQIGYGAGSRDPAGHPNVLRVFLGESFEKQNAVEGSTVTVVEANVDDMSPAVCGFLMDKALEAGALDVFFTPVQMKKNRPGTMITILCLPEKLDLVSDLLFRETTTIGLRHYQTRRRMLERRQVRVETSLGSVRMKVASLDGTVLNVAPEFEDCQRLAAERGVPLKQVLEEARFAFRQQQGGRD